MTPACRGWTIPGRHRPGVRHPGALRLRLPQWDRDQRPPTCTGGGGLRFRRQCFAGAGAGHRGPQPGRHDCAAGRAAQPRRPLRVGRHGLPGRAEAVDDSAVAGLQFLLDGQPIGPVLVAAPYTFDLDTRTLADGSYLVSGVGAPTDLSGNVGTSAAVAVSIGNHNRPPTAVLDLEQARTGSTRSATGSASGLARSSDPEGSALSCSWAFGDGGTAVGSSTGHAYAAAGSYLVSLESRTDPGHRQPPGRSPSTRRGRFGKSRSIRRRTPWSGPASKGTTGGAPSWRSTTAPIPITAPEFDLPVSAAARRRDHCLGEAAAPDPHHPRAPPSGLPGHPELDGGHRQLREHPRWRHLGPGRTRHALDDRRLRCRRRQRPRIRRQRRVGQGPSPGWAPPPSS